MKKFLAIVFGVFVFGFYFSSVVSAEEHPFLGPRPTASDKMQLEGWIEKMEYTKSSFSLRDYRGFATRVLVKEGNINDFKLGDRVKVRIRYDKRAAEMIEKIY